MIGKVERGTATSNKSPTPPPEPHHCGLPLGFPDLELSIDTLSMYNVNSPLDVARSRSEYLGELHDVIGSLTKYANFTQFQNGVHTFSVMRSGDWVYKILTNQELLWIADQLQSHNLFFFNKTPYSFCGVAEDVGDPYYVVRQPYIDFIDGSGSKARKMLTEHLRSLLGEAELFEEDGCCEIHAKGWLFDDLKDTNLGMERNTESFAVIDCIIHKGTVQ